MKKLKVYLVNSTDVLGHKNKGYQHGIEEEKLGDYVEWFKTKKERNEYLKNNKMMVLTK